MALFHDLACTRVIERMDNRLALEVGGERNPVEVMILDVSTLKELALRWRPAVAERVVKQGKPFTLDDIRDSIAEPHQYWEHFLCV